MACVGGSELGASAREGELISVDGGRVIIGHYLTYAIRLARKEFDLNRLVCSSEIDVAAEQIPNVGYLSGTLDFMIATTTGQGGSVFNFVFLLTNS